MNSNFYLFQNLEKETLEVEYKEFSYKVHLDKYYDRQEINDIVLGIRELDERFNTSILDNLKFYSKFYIPKYISAFCNGELKNKGKLMIGVDDYGEIVGIPYLGKIPKENIKNYIMRQIHDSIITTNTTMNYILTNIKIHIDRLEINKKLIYSDLEKKIEKINETYKNYSKQLEEYQKAYENWYSQLAKYAMKLVDLMKYPEVFRELFNYIAERDNSKLFVLSQDIDSYMDDIHIEKHNENNILYWVCKFRDDKVDEVIAQRPEKLKTKSRTKFISYVNEFLKLGNLRKLFLETNPAIQYYLVTIEIPNNCPDEVFYKDIHNIISKRTRLMECGEPVCR